MVFYIIIKILKLLIIPILFGYLFGIGFAICILMGMLLIELFYIFYAMCFGTAAFNCSIYKEGLLFFFLSSFLEKG